MVKNILYQGKPLVSIVVNCLNCSKYLLEALKSIEKQTYPNIELIFVDNCSTDNSAEILSRVNMNVQYLKLKSTIPLYAARNEALNLVNGYYVAFLDSDDEWLPNKIEHQINKMKEKKLDFIHGSYFIINEQEKFIGKFIAESLNYNKLISSCDIGLSTVMVASKLIKKISFPKLSTKEDYVFWLMLVKKLNILYGDEKVVMQYRKKKKSLSSNLFIKFSNAYKVYNTYENKNLIISLLRTIALSVNYIIKQRKIVQINPYPINFKYIKDFSNFKFNKSFMFVALNMASLSYLKLLYFNSHNLIFWIDGFCAKFLINNFKKTAGKRIINKINFPKDINKIYLCGNNSILQTKFLREKFNKEINIIKLPYFKNLKDIIKYDIIIDDNSLVFLNISTPKQEIVAKSILKKNLKKKIFIFCLGGGIAMAVGEERSAPASIEEMILEWLWRLQTKTIFRLQRLILTSSIFFFRKITFFYKNIIFSRLS